ncbi:hypothetical protein AQ14_586 [Francisella tularensis subsp. novicida D9876]|uniref:hypothetical protein n=1 Tax=Francisella tularensis TaxID=263 RepID=UPI0005A5779C|nr:hypothetical protein [Francisella tularensis]AJI72475.1 hypothetical protein AQ14_586 [Francisella tularensis subsp. novicida D9876]
MTKIFLDNNIFDFLYDREIDLLHEFPKEQFIICVPKEVKFESECIKDSDKLSFVKSLFVNHTVITHSYFGFYNDEHLPEYQRNGGFDKGLWASSQEISFKAILNDVFLKKDGGKHYKHDLYKNEGDIALAVRSVHNIVLTNDRKGSKGAKKGPLNYAYDEGYGVVFLNDYDDIVSLNEYVRSSLESRGLNSW